MYWISLLAYAILMATVLANGGSGITKKLVIVNLDEEVAQNFLDCVVAISDRHYMIHVSAPWIVVIPFARRALDLANDDRDLANCAREVAETLMVQLGSTQYGHSEYTNAKSVFDVDVAELVRLGAKSLRVVASTIPNPDAEEDSSSSSNGEKRKRSIPSPMLLRPNAQPEPRAQLSRRWPHQDQYFVTFPSDYPGCLDIDYVAHQYDQCFSRWMFYTSILAGNSHGDHMLHFQIWPHHNCEQGNTRVITVPSNTISPCLEDRRIYSHKGYLLAGPKQIARTKSEKERQRQTQLEEAKARSREAQLKRKEWKEQRARDFKAMEQSRTSDESALYKRCPMLKFLRSRLARSSNSQRRLGYSKSGSEQSLSQNGRGRSASKSRGWSKGFSFPKAKRLTKDTDSIVDKSSNDRSLAAHFRNDEI